MTPQKIREIAGAFQKSRILLTAIELKIFTALDNGKMKAVELAEKVSADARATERLCNALVNMEFLGKEKDYFFNTELSVKFLNENSADFLSNLHHTNHLWNSWHTLTESVKLGHSISQDEIADRDEAWRESFIEAMHYRAEAQAKELAQRYIDLSNVNSLIDVGGGSGAFSFGFINAKPDIKAVIFDLPNIIPVTEKYVRKFDKSKQVFLMKGDYLNDSFGGKYDLIFLSAIIHINNFEENQSLIKKCFDSLNDNGQVIIQDFVMSENRLSPAHGSFFALNMLVGTKHGDTYTENEIRNWFDAAGAKKIKRIDTSFGTSLIIGKN